MAITTNTTQSIKQTSSVLAPKCEATQKNMKKLCREAGLGEDAKMVQVTIPRIPGSYDDVVFAGLNGTAFYFLRGQKVSMPEAVQQMLVNCGVL